MRVLVIDDEPKIRELILLIVKELDHEAYEAADGLQGCRLAETIDFDLVITDIIMPNLEGIETIAYLRKRQPNLKIIAMSGGGRGRHTELLDVAERMGAQVTLVKPFHRSALLAALTQVFED